MVPTWTLPQVRNLALLVSAIYARHSLVITELAREYPSEDGEGPHDLRYRVKRVWRFINNPLLRTDRLMDSLYRLAVPLCTVPGDLLPILLDTTFFEPFALLTASLVVGGRGLPVRWVTYHRHELEAVFARDGCKGKIQETMLSENLIEQRLVDEVWAKVVSGIRAVLVADRGFASADFFQWMLQKMRHFVVRFKADTHITVIDAKGEPITGAAKEVIPAEPGQKRWVEGVMYRKDGALRVNVLVVFDVGQEEPWYLATDSSDPAEVEQLYRWRMREEREYKDCKDQLLLGKKGTRMTVQNVASAARLLDALMVLHWFVALVGLQAMRDLPETDQPRQNSRSDEIGDGADIGTETQIDTKEDASSQGEPEGPAIAPEPKPRIEGALIPYWLRRFQVRGPISYIKLGLEFLRLPGIRPSLAKLIAWITDKLSAMEPLWTRRQARYRARLSRFG